MKTKSRSVRKSFAALLCFAAVISVVGCKKKDDTPPNSANVAFVNACAGTPGIDAKVNNTNVSGAVNLGFLGNSGYKAITAGSPVTLAYFLTNVGTPVSKLSTTLATGANYTAFCSGILTAPTFLLVSDDLTAPSSSNAKIRFVNLSSDNMSVTANAQTTVFASAITSLKASDFFSIPAGTYEIKAGDLTNLATIVTAGPKQLAAGKIYTVIMTGTLAGTDQSALHVTLLNNN